MISVNVRETRAKLSALLDRVAAGERVVITRYGQPVAELVPYKEGPRTKQRVPGRDRGLVLIGPDFDDPLPEFEKYI